MDKDWTGNKRTTFATLGASNHSDHARQEHDYYATDPVAIDMLAQTGFFDDVKTVWEPACGGGHLAKAMQARGLSVYATDLYDQGYGQHGVDFLSTIADKEVNPFMRARYSEHGREIILDPRIRVDSCDAIVTNPPYKYAQEFCAHAIELGVRKIAMFLKLTFLEGQKRQKLFQTHPPRYVAVCINRVQCALNGDPEMFAKSSAACYAWFIWEREFQGNPEILWISRPTD